MIARSQIKKALIVASVASMLEQFNRSNIRILAEAGLEVHVAANFVNGSTISAARIQAFSRELRDAGVKQHHIDFERSVWRSNNIRSYRSLRRLIEHHAFDLIHCHSPIGGALTRLAARRGTTPVIYTAHGFHFFRGSSASSWLLYYPIERWLSRFTQTLITINQEDTERARQFPCRVEFVPGVGVNCDRFRPGSLDARRTKRSELGLKESQYLMICPAEINTNKNQRLLLEAIPTVIEEYKEFVLFFIGDGPKRAECEQLVDDLQIRPYVRFLGYREDMSSLYQAADAAALVSFREGLPMVVMEAMASGLPVVATNCRGNTDLLGDRFGEFLIPATADPASLGRKIVHLMQRRDLGWQMGRDSMSMIRANYSEAVVEKRMRDIYASVVL